MAVSILVVVVPALGGSERAAEAAIDCLGRAQGSLRSSLTAIDYRTSPTRLASLSWSVSAPAGCTGLTAAVTPVADRLPLAAASPAGPVVGSGTLPVGPVESTTTYVLAVSQGPNSLPLANLTITVTNRPGPVVLTDGAALRPADLQAFDDRWLLPFDWAYTLGVDYHNNIFGAWHAMLYRCGTQCAWGISERMIALARMYEVTHARRYLDRLHDYTELVLANRDDFYPGNVVPGCPGRADQCAPHPIDAFRGVNEPAWGGFDPSSGDKGTVDVGGSSLYGYAIAWFARLVAEDPTLQPTYGRDAVRYGSELARTMLVFLPDLKTSRQPSGAVWNYLANHGVGGALTKDDCQAAYCLEITGVATHQDDTCLAPALVTDPQALYRQNEQRTACEELVSTLPGQVIEAFNYQSMYMMFLVELGRLLDSEFYRRAGPPPIPAVRARNAIPAAVTRYQRFWRDKLEVAPAGPGDGFYWAYQIRDGSRHEDTVHGIYEMLYLDVLGRNLSRLAAQVPRGEPLALAPSDPHRFANTFLGRIAIDTNFRYDIDGNKPKPNEHPDDYANIACYGWGLLSAADARVYDRCAEVTLRVVDGAQPYLTIGAHATLLAEKQYRRQAVHEDLTTSRCLPTVVGRPAWCPPRPAGTPFGYAFDAQGVTNVVYRATDGHVRGAWRQGGQIGDDDLSGLAGAPLSAGDPGAYPYPQQSLNNVVYRAGDGNVHRLFWDRGAVTDWNLTASLGLAGVDLAAPVEGDPVGYAIPFQGYQNVVYRAANGHLHGLYWSTGSLGHDDLTAESGAPTAAARPLGYVSLALGIQVVVYAGSDGHLHDLYWSNGAVGHDDLTRLSGAPAPAAGSRASAYFDEPAGLHEAVYVDGGGHLRELFWSLGPVGSGDLTELTATPEATASPSAYPVPGDGSHHALYCDRQGHVHELAWFTGAITHTDLTALAGAPPAVCVGPAAVSAYYSAVDQTHHVAYRGGDGDLHEIRWTAGVPTASFNNGPILRLPGPARGN